MIGEAIFKTRPVSLLIHDFGQLVNVKLRDPTIAVVGYFNHYRHEKKE